MGGGKVPPPFSFIMKKLPALENCFKCKHKVFEFDDNKWGCDTCKTEWSYSGKTWVSNNQNKIKKGRLIKVSI